MHFLTHFMYNPNKDIAQNENYRSTSLMNEYRCKNYQQY